MLGIKASLIDIEVIKYVFLDFFFFFLLCSFLLTVWKASEFVCIRFFILSVLIFLTYIIVLIIDDHSLIYRHILMMKVSFFILLLFDRV